MSAGRLLLLIAVIIFVLAALPLSLGVDLGLVPLGLAFFAASFLVS